MLRAAVLCASLACWSAIACAQDTSDDLEEVIVRGQRLSDFRSALEAARARVYELFNALNSDDAFDVHCREEAPTGSRVRQQVCRPRFVDDISSAAAREWVYGLKEVCPGGLTQDCIFSEFAQQAMSRAQAEEAWGPIMQKRFELEMARVVAESPELQQAMLDYEAVERRYEEARGGGRRARRCERPDPPPRCSR